MEAGKFNLAVAGSRPPRMLAPAMAPEGGTKKHGIRHEQWCKIGRALHCHEQGLNMNCALVVQKAMTCCCHENIPEDS